MLRFVTVLTFVNFCVTKRMDPGAKLDEVKALREVYYFENPNKTEFLTRFETEYKEIKTADRIQLLGKLGHIAMYSRLMKHGASDPREMAADPYREFPKPFFKRLDDDVNAACNVSVIKCINDIHAIIKNTTFWLQEAFFEKGKGGKGVQGRTNLPFDRIREVDSNLFDFMGRAAEFYFFGSSLRYYFCWFTKLRIQLMKYLPYCDFDIHAYKGLKWERQYLHENPFLIDRFNTHPFECAEFSFCPDPCCGRIFQREHQKQDCITNPKNPCHSLSNQECKILPEKNEFFADLVRNHINISCYCDEGVGFEMDLDLGICVDIDECERGKTTCKQDQMCMNTIGSYRCLCVTGEENNGNNCKSVQVPLIKWSGPALAYGRSSNRLFASDFLLLFNVLLLQ